jgi:hypothetical protein
VIDLDATLVTAHSDKESAAPTFKRGYGFHPLCAFADQGAAGSGEGPRTGRWNPAEPPAGRPPHTPTPENESNKPIRKPSGHHARPEKDPA